MYKEELERIWWDQWKVQCFDSLIPTKAWHTSSRGVRVGDVVLISYTDKSKTGTFRLGMVESVEIDSDGLVRNCEVTRYEIRVPVQRLCVILSVEEQEDPPFLKIRYIECCVWGYCW